MTPKSGLCFLRPQKDRILAEATSHLHVAALKGAGPAWLALNNASLLARIGQKEQAIRQLEEIYTTVNDDQTRAAIRERLARLRTESYAEAIQAAVEHFETERKTNFPYLGADFFLLVGPKVQPTYAGFVADRFTFEALTEEMPTEEAR